MPDAYGNPTPQEVYAAIQKQSAQNFYRAQATGDPAVQFGASLAAIFGNPLKTEIDTRRARKAEAARLMKTQGLTEEEAKEEAKASVGRDRAEVRRAKQVQEATGEVQEFIDSLPAEIPLDMRTAQGKLMLSNRMRSMGLTTEANNLATEANNEIIAAQQAALERDNLLSRTEASRASADSSRASAAKTRAEMPYVGTTSFQQNVMAKEQIIAQLNDPNTQLTPEQRDSLLRAKGHLEAKIHKDSTIVGRTESDIKNDPVLMRKLFSDISDKQVLLNELHAAEEMLMDLDSFDSSVWAGLTKDFLGFAENYFGRKPSESEREFMDRIIDKEGRPTIIAAKIRHSLTGAQMSAFEIVYLQPFLPSPEDSVQEMVGKMRVIKEYTQLDVDTRMELFRNGLTEKFLSNAGSGITENKTVTDGEVSLTQSEADAAADDSLAAEIRRRQQGK